MPKILYVKKRFSTASLEIVNKANEIIGEYAAQGFSLTLRQLYYQFVARGVLPNTQKSYKHLGSIVNDARLAGLIDWNHITDRTRHVRSLSHWNTPGDIIQSAAASYRIDMWENQEYRPEVWIEKDALVGVIEGVCNEYDVPYFSCRGYTSQSEMWSAGQRLHSHALGRIGDPKRPGQIPIIFHFGDHDPSGKDMTRDIEDRLKLFMGGVEIERLALNMDQIEEFEPPPNPAKTTDTRAAAYIKEFGNESWELDALDPKTLVGLIRASLHKLIDQVRWDKDAAKIVRERKQLSKAAANWAEVVKSL